MIDVVAKLTSPWWKPALGLLGGVFTYLFPQVTREAAYAVLALMLMDLLTGVLAAVAERTLVTSYGIKRTLMKMAAYFCVIAVVGIVPRHIQGLSGIEAFSVGTAIGVIILTEAKSILENVRRMGFDLPFNVEPVIRRKLAELAKSGSAKEPEHKENT